MGEPAACVGGVVCAVGDGLAWTDGGALCVDPEVALPVVVASVTADAGVPLPDTPRVSCERSGARPDRGGGGGTYTVRSGAGGVMGVVLMMYWYSCTLRMRGAATGLATVVLAAAATSEGVAAEEGGGTGGGGKTRSARLTAAWAGAAARETGVAGVDDRDATGADAERAVSAMRGTGVSDGSGPL